VSGERGVLVFVIAFVAALLGSMSGGSASALTTPAWLAMGVPLPTAVATDKLAGALWTLLGARNYLAGRSVDWRLLAGMISLGLIGAWFGALVIVRLDPEILKRVVGGLILLLIAAMLLLLDLAPNPAPCVSPGLPPACSRFPSGSTRECWGRGTASRPPFCSAGDGDTI